MKASQSVLFKPVAAALIVCALVLLHIFLSSVGISA